jgi:hypothetical protein
MVNGLTDLHYSERLSLDREIRNSLRASRQVESGELFPLSNPLELYHVLGLLD